MIRYILVTLRNTLRYSKINIKLNTYSQNAVPNELILHLAPFPHGFGLQEEKPEKNEEKLQSRIFDC